MNRFEKKDLDAVAYRLVQAMNKETPSMPADPYDPASSKTKLWLDELVETTKKRHKRVMRALRTGAVVSCSIFLFITSTFTVDAARKEMYYFFDKAFASTQQAEQTWDSYINPYLLEKCNNVYLPTWMPEGYIADSCNKTGSIFSIDFIASNDCAIIFRQSGAFDVNYADSEMENMKILHIGKQTLYYGEKTLEDYRFASLMWQNNGNQYSLYANAPSYAELAREADLVKIFESLQYKR